MRQAATLDRCNAVVFDCGDTLVRLDPPREQIFLEVATTAGLDLRCADVTRAYELVDFSLRMRSSRLRTLVEKEGFYLAFNTALCDALGVHSWVATLHPRLVKTFAARRRWVAFEDAASTLLELGTEWAIHVLANWDETLDHVLREVGIRHLIGDAAASVVLGHEKPDRACFDAFLARNRLSPDETIYVGNEYQADVVGAREAGLTPILIDRFARFSAADCLRVGTLSELVPLLFGEAALAASRHPL